MGSQKLHVILGRKAATADFRQRKAHKADKESSLSFRFVAFARFGLLLRRPQNDSDNESNVIFADSFVWSNTKTHFALCKSFRPAFFKRLAAGGTFSCKRNAPINYNFFSSYKSHKEVSACTPVRTSQRSPTAFPRTITATPFIAAVPPPIHRLHLPFLGEEELAPKSKKQEESVSKETESETIAVSTPTKKEPPSLLSALLPPRPNATHGGGILGDVGTEELLIIGIILLLSQNQSDDDILLLLLLLLFYK